jgi:DNA (cytosine-5)-methyltransferase 1
MRASRTHRPTDLPPAIDLFAGCGGTSLGLLAAGFDVRAAVEKDSVAASSYDDLVGVGPIVRDIRKVGGAELLEAAGLRSGECRLLAACPPCQGFSSQRRGPDGLADSRNQLIYQVARLVEAIRPGYLLFENVPGLYLGSGAQMYKRVRARLERAGYEIIDDILDAADYGVPQRRARLIALARRRDMPSIGFPMPTHTDPGNRLRGTGRRRWRTVRNFIEKLRPLKSGETDPNDPLHTAPGHTEMTLRRIMAISADGGSRTDLPPELRLGCHLRRPGGYYDVYGRMAWDEPAPTITGGCNKPSKGRFIHPEQHRAVTLREAALLQTFPKSAFFRGDRDQIASQIGNAVPPTFVEKLARPIATF